MTNAPFRPFETEVDEGKALNLLEKACAGAEDGELFLERSKSEALVLDDGRVKTASFDTSQGFGMRAVLGEVAGYAHSTEISEAAMTRAVETARLAVGEGGGTMAVGPKGTNTRLYEAIDPIESAGFSAKLDILKEIDAYARALDPRVVQVTASVSATYQEVEILRVGGQRLTDVRPMTRLNVGVIVEQDGRRESGSAGGGGRVGLTGLLEPSNWQANAREALRIALVNLEAVPAPAGQMDIVLGPGWPGILLHEAIGHGLEGDFNRKKTSAFAGLRGERVASPGVTVVDDGTLEDRRGSLSIDDEGTPSEYTTLIEDGILKGYMQDRMNARLMGEGSTGNGRRQSYAHMPMPRMTNTYMLAGDRDPNEILASVDNGLYATSFGGGQVDITNGKFVFTCTEAYKIENGKVTTPVKGATLIGSGPDVLTKVTMIGNDLEMDPGIGTCGKNGQGVPVGVGQPTLRIDGLTVGGTAV